MAEVRVGGCGSHCGLRSRGSIGRLMGETQRSLPTGFQETLLFSGYSRSHGGHGCPGGRIVRRAAPKAEVPGSVLWLEKMEPKWTDSLCRTTPC